jgi:hypothetical protein
MPVSCYDVHDCIDPAFEEYWRDRTEDYPTETGKDEAREAFLYGVKWGKEKK